MSFILILPSKEQVSNVYIIALTVCKGDATRHQKAHSPSVFSSCLMHGSTFICHHSQCSQGKSVAGKCTELSLGRLFLSHTAGLSFEKAGGE